MTVRDGARYLEQALASVRAQTFADWELVLWDDGSTDDTPAIARAFAASEPRVRLAIAEPMGRRRALVEAHQRARGRYLGWLDADDWLAPEALARTHAVLARGGCDLVYTDHLVVGPDGAPRGLGRRARIPYCAHRLLLDFMTFHFRLFSREVFDRAGGIDPRHEIAIDYDLCLRISEHGRITHLAEPLYFYREHAEQMSTRHRAPQAAASAAAIRAALVRRGLTQLELQLDDARRFRLVHRSAREPATRGLLPSLIASAFSRRRPRWLPTTGIGFWPATSESTYRRRLYAAAGARGLDVRALGGDLARLVRLVWTGRAGSTLHIHDLEPLFASRDDGGVVGACLLFLATLDHARARGMRVVWIARGPLATHPRHAARERWCRRALAARCDAIVTHWQPDVARLHALGGGDRVACVPHPDLADGYPLVSRAAAREQLGLAANATVVLYVGPSVRSDDRDLVLAADLDAQPPRRVATYFAAADLVVLLPSHATSTNVALALALGVPVVAPAIPGMDERVGERGALYSPSDGDDEISAAVARALAARPVASPAGERTSWDATLSATVA